MKIVLPIYFNNPELGYAYAMGLETSVETSIERYMFFYTINAVSDYYYKGKVYGMVYSNGEAFISPMTKEAIDKEITKFKLN